MPIETELRTLVHANYSLIYLTTWEEERALTDLARIAAVSGRRLVTWSLTRGFRDPAKRLPEAAADHTNPTNPNRVLKAIEDYPDPALIVLCDFHPFMQGDGEPAQRIVARQLRDLALAMRKRRQSLVFLSPRLVFPRDLEKDLVVLTYPLPDRDGLRQLVDAKLAKHGALVGALAETDRENLTQALRGLTMIEAENALFKALARLSLAGERLDSGTVGRTLQTLLGEKEQVIKKSGTLQFYAASEQIEDIGGLDRLKAWLTQRRLFFSESAAALGLPRPKGVLLLGLPGCGKSMTAKAVSATWGLPLLKLDLGAIFGQYVGQSEENMRRALATAEAVAPCVLWVDEIEKGLGATANDGGVTLRVFGTFLTWMQEQSHGVFVVATANDVSRLPPELMRRGRFDELFFVSNPQPREREEIFRRQLQRLAAALRQGAATYDLPALSRATRNCSGAEIASVVQEAAMLAFAERRRVTSADLLAMANQTQPLAMTFRDRLDQLRVWAGRCAPASTPEAGDDADLGPIPTRTLG